MKRIAKLSHSTRRWEDFDEVLSVRGSLSIFEQAQAFARLRGSRSVDNEDVEKAASSGYCVIDQPTQPKEPPTWIVAQSPSERTES